MARRFVAPKRLESLEQVQRALQRVQEQLDALNPPKRGGLITSDVTLRAGEFVRISPRSGTVFAKLPKASAENYGLTVTISLERPAGTLRIAAEHPDTVNGVAATNFSDPTLITLQSNGVDSWVSVAALPSTAPGAGWPGVLANDNTSGASNPTISAGQRLIVPGGQSAGDGDINSASDLTLHAATDIHLHADGNIHVGHAGSATDVHVEGEQIDIATDVGAVTISASTTANISATASSTIQTGTFFAVNATGDITMTSGDAASLTGSTSVLVTGAGNGLSASAAAFAMAAGTTSVFAFTDAAMSFRTAGTTRLTIGAAGGWTVNSSEGTAGQYLRSSGAAATPTWATIDVSEVAGAQPTLSAGDGIDIASNVVSVDVSDLVGGGLEDDGSNNLRTSAVTGAISRAAGSTASLFAGIRDNGSLETARGFINVLSSTSIVAAVAQDAGNNEQEWTWQRAALSGAIVAAQNVNSTVFGTMGFGISGSGTSALSINLAADYDWTGEHWFAGPVFFDDPADPNIALAGDIRGVTLTVRARSNIEIATEAGTGDVTIQSGLSGTLGLVAGAAEIDADDYVDIAANDDVWLNGDSVTITSGVNTPGAGGTAGGFLKLLESSASTPSVAAGFGMHWVRPADPWGGTAPSVPAFTDDTNVDHEVATIGPPPTIVSFGSGDVTKGTVFCLTKAIVSSGSASAGDAAVFTTGTAPFSFRILLAGYFPTAAAAAATVILRTAASGGGTTLGAAMNASPGGVYQSWLGGATTLDPVIAAGGQLYARCSRRDFSGILWMLCVRT